MLLDINAVIIFQIRINCCNVLLVFCIYYREKHG